MKGWKILYVFGVLWFVIVNTAALPAEPVVLNYDADAYSYAHVEFIYTDTDTDTGFSHNGTAEASAMASMDIVGDWWQMSNTETVVKGVYDSNGAELVSNIKGWGQWHDYYSGEWGTGGGDGYGYTSMAGTIEIGYSAGWEGVLIADAAITGDPPGNLVAWYTWDWWLNIWDSDPNSPLAVLDDDNLSASLDVLGGDILNMQFYYEAGTSEYWMWPNEGLESTVTVDLSAVPEPATILLFALGGSLILLKKRKT